MNETTDATSIFAPLWRRKWLVLAVGLVVAAASYYYYKRQTPVYQATTQVYLGAGLEEQAPGERASTKGQGVAISNQVAVINSIIIEEVRRQLRKEHKKGAGVGKVKAKAEEKSEFITITAEGHTAKGVALLANATAQTYIKRQQRVRQAVIERAIVISRRQLRRIEASSVRRVTPKTTGSKSKSTAPVAPSTTNVLQEAALNSKINQLESSLGGSGSQQIKPAKAASARMLSPQPRKNAIFGFVVGLALAAIAAYVLARTDRRLRSLAGVEAVFQTQILAGFPRVRRPIVRRDGQVTPSKLLLEALRRLHVALQLASTSSRESARVILFTSPDPGDGKSTLVADLALVQREAGERVAVIEANLRHPVQAKLLGLDGSRGLVDVLSGTLSVEEAMQRVLPDAPQLHTEPLASAGRLPTAVAAPAGGSLFLLSGATATNPPALLGNEAMSRVLQAVAADFDYVLIDAPSPLEVSDVVPLLNSVDGIVVVARLGQTREASARRLAQLLTQAAPSRVLGTAANCVPRREAERFGISTPNGRVRPGRLLGR
jgi:Mrp family chromosome partitioning ATPase